MIEAVVDGIRLLALAMLVGGGVGWLIWWWHQHGPEKERDS